MIATCAKGPWALEPLAGPHVARLRGACRDYRREIKARDVFRFLEQHHPEV
jgi:hypothetical protein